MNKKSDEQQILNHAAGSNRPDVAIPPWVIDACAFLDLHFPQYRTFGASTAEDHARERQHSDADASEKMLDLLTRIRLQCEELRKRFELPEHVQVVLKEGAALAVSAAGSEGAIVLEIEPTLLKDFPPRDQELIIARELARCEWNLSSKIPLEAAERFLMARSIEFPQCSATRHTLSRLQQERICHCDLRSSKTVDDLSGMLELLNAAIQDPAAYPNTALCLQLEVEPFDDRPGPATEDRLSLLRAADAPGRASDTLLEPVSMEWLDLMQQAMLRTNTQNFVSAFLQHNWMWTPAVRAAAAEFSVAFPDSSTDSMPSRTDPSARLKLAEDLSNTDNFADDVRQYFCFVLLDLATADRELTDAMIAAGLLFARDYSVVAEFRELVISELQAGRRALQKLEDNAQDIISAAAKEAGR